MYICVVREDIQMFFYSYFYFFSFNRDFFDEIPIFIVHLSIVAIRESNGY